MKTNNDGQVVTVVSLETRKAVLAEFLAWYSAVHPARKLETEQLVTGYVAELVLKHETDVAQAAHSDDLSDGKAAASAKVAKSSERH